MPQSGHSCNTLSAPCHLLSWVSQTVHWAPALAGGVQHAPSIAAAAAQSCRHAAPAGALGHRLQGPHCGTLAIGRERRALHLWGRSCCEGQAQTGCRHGELLSRTVCAIAEHQIQSLKSIFTTAKPTLTPAAMPLHCSLQRRCHHN